MTNKPLTIAYICPPGELGWQYICSDDWDVACIWGMAEKENESATIGRIMVTIKYHEGICGFFHCDAVKDHIEYANSFKLKSTMKGANQ